MGTWGHEAAVSAGVRLVSVNRPGYGGSTATAGAPSLLATGRDTAVLAAHLGCERYAVFGLSGGGPFAVAAAIAEPGHVGALGIVGGVGPWRVLDDKSRDPDGRACLALLDAGNVAGAWDCMRRDIERRIRGPCGERRRRPSRRDSRGRRSGESPDPGRGVSGALGGEHASRAGWPRRLRVRQPRVGSHLGCRPARRQDPDPAVVRRDRQGLPAQPRSLVRRSDRGLRAHRPARGGASGCRRHALARRPGRPPRHLAVRQIDARRVVRTGPTVSRAAILPSTTTLGDR